MKIDKFIQEYNKANDKKKYISKHIITNYIPLGKKIDEMNTIVRNTSFKAINRKEIYKKNSVLQYALYSIRMILLYTDLEIEQNYMVTFDKLDEFNLINEIINNIPEKESTEMLQLLNMINDDCYDDNHNFVNYIDNKIDSIVEYLSVLEKVFKESENKNGEK